ncbi:TPA: hypothetical protein DEG21_05185 [Patescibacteria group bacterium]|nr:hypothetical protein [Candidatus Gracilibacteria bacterium]
MLFITISSSLILFRAVFCGTFSGSFELAASVSSWYSKSAILSKLYLKINSFSSCKSSFVSPGNHTINAVLR